MVEARVFGIIAAIMSVGFGILVITILHENKDNLTGWQYHLRKLLDRWLP
jgi:hypothetical protein